MVQSRSRSGRTSGPSRRRAIATFTKKKPSARPKPAPKPAPKAGSAKRTRAAPARPRVAAKSRPRAAARRRRVAALAPASEHPLGMGVADGFAMGRLNVPARMKRAPKKAMREIGWAAFGEMARTLAARIADRYRPDVVLGIAKGGVFVGGALSAALGADFFPVRIERRSRDATPHPDASTELPVLDGKRVLLVDDVAATGATLARGRAMARKSGAREVRTCVLVVRPGGARPDWFAIETGELILFGWDYQLEHAASGHGPLDPGEVGV